MRTAYVIQDGATLGREGERLTVSVRRERQQEVQTRELQQLVLVGNITLTPGAVELIVEKGIDAILLGHHGRYKGRITGAISGNITLRLAQYRTLTTTPQIGTLCRAIIQGKLANQRALLMRHARRHGSNQDLRMAIQSLAATLLRLTLCTTVDEYRGCEGAGAAAYFRVFGHLLRQPTFTFHGRNRRPPRDPVNALLSLGYTLLANQVHAAVEIVGLDPYLGALHSPQGHRPSLVCDLMEEHRAPLVDAVVVAGINRRVFLAEHFDQLDPETPVTMKREAVRALATLFERRLLQKITYGPQNHSTTWRDVIELQCRRFARWLLDDEPYEAFTPP